jgi:acetoin utilization deacetylase AcuC-like enzyme
LAAALRGAGEVAAERVEAPRATREQLQHAHGERYVDQVLALAGLDRRVQLDPDTSAGPGSVEAALRAAGAAVHAVDLVLGGAHARAFGVVRPPGHHAEWERSMGFCLFSNVAVAARHAVHAHGLERIAIVDFDVHHGNGTEDILGDDPRVLFCSSFQHPFYPGSGADSRAANVVNVPLPAGTDGPAWRAAVSAAWFDRLEAFRPELVLVSAGFDAHRDDPLANLALDEDDFGWITRELVAIAERHASGRVVALLEGGYDLGALERSAAATARELA